MIHHNNESGYSADREGSASSSPFNTIEVVDGSSKKNESMRKMNNCPKRHKRSELQFAASSVKADLARAGIEFSAVDPQCESTSKFGDVSISLKGVKLMGSKEFGKNPLVNRSAQPGSLQEYQALALACFGLYPRSLAKPAKISTMSQDSDRSTSSVSESDTESVTSKTNLQSDPEAPYVIPPLSKETSYKTMSAAPHNPSDSCGLLSMSRNALSLSETMALTNTPRYVQYSNDVPGRYTIYRIVSSSLSPPYSLLFPPPPDWWQCRKVLSQLCTPTLLSFDCQACPLKRLLDLALPPSSRTRTR